MWVVGGREVRMGGRKGRPPCSHTAQRAPACQRGKMASHSPKDPSVRLVSPLMRSTASGKAVRQGPCPSSCARSAVSVSERSWRHCSSGARSSGLQAGEWQEESGTGSGGWVGRQAGSARGRRRETGAGLAARPAAPTKGQRAVALFAAMAVGQYASPAATPWQEPRIPRCVRPGRRESASTPPALEATGEEGDRQGLQLP